MRISCECKLYRYVIDLNTDVKQSIDNPFSRISEALARREGRDFAQQIGLEERADLFERAGLVLHDPGVIPGSLPLDEQHALTNETRANKHLWRSIREGVFKTGESTLWQELFPQSGFFGSPKQLRSTILMLCVSSSSKTAHPTGRRSCGVHTYSLTLSQNAAIVQGWCQASR